MNLLQTFILAIVQGITELFPISSLAHSVLTPYVFGWNLNEEFLKQNFLPFMVMLHLGTALSLFLFFNNEWKDILNKLYHHKYHDNRLLYLIIVGSIPAVIIGFSFEKILRFMFSNVTNASFFLIMNGFLLYAGEKFRKRGTKTLNEMTFKEAFFIGICQCIAFIPGFSRSGATITGGFIAGLKHSESLRFSMLLAAPIILGAAVVEIPHLVESNITNTLSISIAGGVISAVMAFLSVWLMTKWFHKNEHTAMFPFAVYCWLVGGGILISRFM
ncbi:undecaprenyl-diphosphate phosphatase [Pectinatus frisingensis]|uniref:undecaprenyl-diphosphate phosphatase n=1 Tax=Pectinatus frisingensis TaxID=865 RepID=UPI0018C70D74|nr:undecaprenyl-diphosphate phosphatase [Pectinatus frisingensis]